VVRPTGVDPAAPEIAHTISLLCIICGFSLNPRMHTQSVMSHSASLWGAIMPGLEHGIVGEFGARDMLKAGKRS
jgi:hypothetical protein